ncbi:MAG: hypothetical protein HY054_15750 [Proteobacteria bacterium]|nr:hypothetical protein [Pseudomonadota bacterium]
MLTATRTTRVLSDHFEPEAALSPEETRKLRGHLEQIDYAAFAANREVLSGIMGRVDVGRFEKLAVATAHARAKWVTASLSITENSHSVTQDQIAQLAILRNGYEELSEAYEAMRRMVERGYLGYGPR